MIAYQLETALLGRLQKHYARTDDEGRTLLHALEQKLAFDSVFLQGTDGATRGRWRAATTS